tara:strand:+ start:376 stop:486 length:111 start_codon:yes stop_codon:yes gene_type:complete
MASNPKVPPIRIGISGSIDAIERFLNSLLGRGGLNI